MSPMSGYLVASVVFWTGVFGLYVLAVRRNAFGLYGRRLQTTNVSSLVASAILAALVARYLPIDVSAAAKAAVLGFALFLPLARWARHDFATKIVGAHYVDRPQEVSARFLLLVFAAAATQALSMTEPGRRAIALAWPVLAVPLAWLLLSLYNLWCITAIERRLGTPLVVTPGTPERH